MQEIVRLIQGAYYEFSRAGSAFLHYTNVR